MALWIASYMVVPLTAMVLMGKRLNQVARVSGSVTVPDVFRDRFNSPTLGIARHAVDFWLSRLQHGRAVQVRRHGVAHRAGLAEARTDIPVLGGNVDQGYLIGLCIFAFTVIAYTTYGGFWAVTWTDVLEGIVKIVGVTMLAIAVRAVADPSTPTAILDRTLRATEHLRQQDSALVEGPGPGQLPAVVDGLFVLPDVVAFLGRTAQRHGSADVVPDSQSLRKAMIVVCGYYVITYS